MMMVKQRVFFAVTAIELIVLCALLLYGRARVTEEERGNVPSKLQLARELELTDLSVWTEARYTRHPSQADSFAPFQDFPSSIEHFPAGSIVVVRPRPIAPPGPERR
jgi:hypothetical protein